VIGLTKHIHRRLPGVPRQGFFCITTIGCAVIVLAGCADSKEIKIVGDAISKIKTLEVESHCERPHYLVVRIRGNLSNGTALITTHNKEQCVIGPGVINHRIANEYYSKNAEIIYIPDPELDGELIFDITFDCM
jgi:hypothetical protein